MKIKYVLIVFILSSCLQKNKGKNTPIDTLYKDTIKQLEEPNIKVHYPKRQLKVNFLNAIKSTREKFLPVIDNTNFDSFIDEADYTKVDIKALKLENIYPKINDITYNCEAISVYKITISKLFYSVVVTVKKDNEEMESVLVNYDLEGHIIDSKVITYDEIVEGYNKYTSEISKDTLTINHIIWAEKKEIQQEFYKIETNGIIKRIDY